MKTRTSAIEDWRCHVAQAGLSDRKTRVGRAVVRRYAAPWRRYHGLAHLDFLFSEIARLEHEIEDPDRLRFAAWFHDAIYTTWRKDNERRSADWARRALQEMGASERSANGVWRLIDATADHGAVSPADRGDALFLDMDIAILGGPPDVYNRYARSVRREYFWVPHRAYAKARSAFLRDQLARERLFHTDRYDHERGAQARENMAQELSRLSSARA